MDRPTPSRRDVLKGAGLATVAMLAEPSLALAAAPTDRRLVVVILRGGLDGLTAVAPVGDPDYRRLRPRIAVRAPGEDGGGLRLDNRYALHPALAPLHALYEKGEMLAVHAVGTPDRSRSHFDAQDVLENGTARARGARDGWLNRAVGAIGGRDLGLAVGYEVPLLMRGTAAVRTWSPRTLAPVDAPFLAQLARSYSGDPLFARTLAEARHSATAAGQAMGDKRMRQRGPASAFKTLAEAAGKLLATSDGPRIASLSLGGWDSHVNQPGRLRRQFTHLAAGLDVLREALDGAWRHSVVVVISEFGRTARENGTRGTDHGTAGVALLLGGRVHGGRVAGSWPGLSETALFQGRDLAPTTDLRAVLKGVLRDQLGVRTAALDAAVFPASAGIRPMGGLIRRG